MIVTLLDVNFDLTPKTNLRTTFDLRAMIFERSNEASETVTAYFEACLAPSYVFAE